ncbi:MAG: helix-hairpin-helix domain-containing protein [Candidatus Acidiferrum sp.]
MRRWLRILGLAFTATVILTLSGAGCSDNSAERNKEIRDEAAKAAAQAKPAVEEATKAVKAAVEGAKEGWESAGKQLVDLNSASESDLTGLPGIGKHEAKRIIAGRPYEDAHDLVSKKILSEKAYEKLKDEVTAK